jgi:hypothetical protein
MAATPRSDGGDRLPVFPGMWLGGFVLPPGWTALALASPLA